MPQNIDSSLVSLKNLLHSQNGWVYLFLIDLDGSNKATLVGHDTTVVHAGITYQAFPISLGSWNRDVDGNLSQPVVTVSNLSREMANYLEAGGLLDRRVRIYAKNLGSTAVLEFGEWRVIEATINLDVATFRIGVYQLFDAPFPARRQFRSRCDYQYGGTECAYQISLPNLISSTNPNFDGSTCDYTIGGDNGCRAHGLNEAANGQFKAHPARFGGFPGIPKGPARV